MQCPCCRDNGWRLCALPFSSRAHTEWVLHFWPHFGVWSAGKWPALGFAHEEQGKGPSEVDSEGQSRGWSPSDPMGTEAAAGGCCAPCSSAWWHCSWHKRGALVLPLDTRIDRCAQLAWCPLLLAGARLTSRPSRYSLERRRCFVQVFVLCQSYLFIHFFALTFSACLSPAAAGQIPVPAAGFVLVLLDLSCSSIRKPEWLLHEQDMESLQQLGTGGRLLPQAHFHSRHAPSTFIPLGDEI